MEPRHYVLGYGYGRTPILKQSYVHMWRDEGREREREYAEEEGARGRDRARVKEPAREVKGRKVEKRKRQVYTEKQKMARKGRLISFFFLLSFSLLLSLTAYPHLCLFPFLFLTLSKTLNFLTMQKIIEYVFQCKHHILCQLYFTCLN